jgi:hypothetical protein
VDEVEKFKYDITCLHVSTMFDKFSGQQGRPLKGSEGQKAGDNANE